MSVISNVLKEIPLVTLLVLVTGVIMVPSGIVLIVRNGLVRGLLKLGIIVVLLLIPIAVIYAIVSAGPTEKPAVPPKRVNVDVVTVRRDTLQDRMLLPMVAESPEGAYVKLAAEVAGKVVWVEKREGDAVRKDEPIAKIDTDTLEAQLNEAKASYTEAKLRNGRIEGLFKRKHVSEEQRDTARAAFERAEAALQVAELQLEKGTVSSPIDGKVERRYVDEGEYVVPGQAVADVVNIDRLYAVVSIPERDRRYVRPGMPVVLRFDNVRTDNPGGAYTDPTAVVRSVSDVGDEMTRTFRAQIEFQNPTGFIKPGMLGTALIVRRPVSDAVLIGNDLIVSKESDTLVYVAAEGRVLARPVQLGLTDGTRFVVKAGLEEGDRVIKEPGLLTPGELIRVRSVDGKPVEEEQEVSQQAEQPSAGETGAGQP